MSKEILQGILGEVIQSAAALKAQIKGQEDQIAAGQAQMVKFDSLIASLQVSIGNDNVLTAIEAQAAANALVSPTSAAPAANDASAATSEAAAPVAG